MSKVSLAKLMQDPEFRTIKEVTDLERNAKENVSTRVDKIVDEIKKQADPVAMIQKEYARYLSTHESSDLVYDVNARYEHSIHTEQPIDLPEELQRSVEYRELTDKEFEQIQKQLDVVPIYSYSSIDSETGETKQESKSVAPDVVMDYTVKPSQFRVSYDVELEDVAPKVVVEESTRSEDDKIDLIIPRPIFDEIESAIGVYLRPVTGLFIEPDELDDPIVPKMDDNARAVALAKGVEQNDSRVYEKYKVLTPVSYYVELGEPTLDLSDLSESEKSL